jgi:hypothetical protein
MVRNASIRRTRRRLVALASTTALLATAGLAHTAVPARADVFICTPAAKPPGGSGTKAHGKWYVECIAPGVEFEIQVQLWERDAGRDQRLSNSGWISAVSGADGITRGKGANVNCNTEAGKEELYSRIRYRYGGPDEDPWPWMESTVVTGRTCS